ncbi:RHS repeat-associated core domain-containing protein [Epilithonimonas sp.]|uniref:RHS repeat-associated core domain-containing protein n=1 Tax=Epilithonimonas sp. TaxID=2894511 RepID=UPI0035ADCFBE
MKNFYTFILSTFSILGFSQTILNQPETASRSVQDPNVVILAPGFNAKSSISNPFYAKIGESTDTPTNPTNSDAGSGNPSGTVGSNSFHDTQGNIEVNGGGQLQYTLPIALPPGVKSVAPQINLVYTNGAGNGIAGYGWSISGITSISRVGRTIEKDGEVRGINMDYSDYYSFNGQRLILKSGEYGKDGAEYVTEKYSNVKIKSVGTLEFSYLGGGNPTFFGPQKFEVTFEDGSQAWYGGDYGRNGSFTPVEYNIIKWKDAQGNYINYNYSIYNKAAVISSIQWGGNEVLNKPHYNEIIFNYITRDYKESSYTAGIPIIQDQLLNNIIVKTNSLQFKKYEVVYKKSGTNYQFVDRITEYNANNEPANPVVFENNTDATVTNIFNQNSRYDEIYGNGIISGDFNGDGKLDFIKDNTIMLGRLDGTGQFVNVTFQGKIFGSGFSKKNNVFLNKNVIYTSEGNFSQKKIIFRSYELLNNSLQLIKQSDVSLSDYPQLFNDDGYEVNYYNGGKSICGYEDGIRFCFEVLEDKIMVDSYKVKEGSYTGDGTSKFLFKIHHVYYGSDIGQGSSGGLDDYYARHEVFYFDPESLLLVKQGINEIEKYQAGDFNGDSKTDLLKLENNNINVYTLNQQNQFVQIFSTTKESLDDKMYLGDFNGDGKADILAPIAQDSSDWRMYISTGKGFDKFYYSNLFLYQPTWQGAPRKNRNIARTYSTSDLNKDGKSDFTIFESQVWYRDGWSDLNNPDSSYGFNYLRNEGVDATGKPIFSNVYNIAPKELNWDGEDINYSMYGEHYIPLFGNFRIAQLNTDFAIIHKTKLITWDLGNKLNKISKIKSITQGGVKTDIEYANLTSTGNIYKSFYDTNPVQYPYVNIAENQNYEVVSRLVQGNRKQEFRYRDMIGHLHGKGMLGFRQSARSTFYADGFEATKVWSGSEINPLNEALPIKDWSIKTNDENSIFPSDISLNNTQLLSYKDYQYKIEKLLNGTVVTSYTDADKPKIVTSINPYVTTSKDFLKDIKTVHTVERYNNIYLPEKSTTNINDGFAITTTELAYNTPNYTIGSNYAIGKPLWKTETMQVYGDTKGGKEEYEYNGSLLTKKRTYNRDYNNSNAQYLEERYVYDGFGNVIEKTIENPFNNDGVQAATTKSQYDEKGRFVIKKTDNLGLDTNLTYNAWGQVLTQSDPIGNTVTNTYDAWGKLLTSKTNLGGTTSYTYEKLSNGDAKVTEYSPDGEQNNSYRDGDQKISYTNKLGQNYKTTVKGFSNGSYVSSDIIFDALGRKIQQADPKFEGTSSGWERTEYDDYSRPKKVTLSTGKIIETSYNGKTVTAQETNVTGRFKTQVYDAIGNLYSVTDKGGTIYYKYNAAGDNIETKYGTNIITTKYDNWGRKSEFNDPANGKYTYEYNGYGQPTHTISPKGHKYYKYNALGQLFKQTESSNDGTSTNKDINFVYDSKGRIIKKYGTSKGEYYDSYINYDANGRVISSGENSNGRYYLKKGITYDNKARVTSYEKSLFSSGVYTKVVIENVYNPWDGSLYQVKDKTSNKVLWELTQTNAKGSVLKAKLGGTLIENTYDANNFLKNVTHTRVTDNSNVLFVNYSFDALKNELNSRTTGGYFNILESFTYDDNNRLKSWTNPKTGLQSTNIYDDQGRIRENDQIGTIKFDNTTNIYRPTGATLNANGQQNYSGNLIQKISYNENNDPVFIDGEKGDVAFAYGLTSMRQRETYGGNFGAGGTGKYTKYYSEDGSYEITRNNQTGQEKHILYIGGSPYDSNIIYLKNYGLSTGSYHFLHKDYLGSILAVTEESGYAIERRHYDAWGNFTNLIIAGSPVNPNNVGNYEFLIDRGYTSHEHLPEVGLIHMNGRLYDPLLRRFLNADENIQDPENTQIYNKYAYVINNPLLYNDPSGEVFGIDDILVAVGVAVFFSVATDYYMNRPVNLENMFQSVVMSLVSAGVSNGIGDIFKAGGKIAEALKGWTWAARAGAHAVTQGTLSYMQGGNFWSGALAGAFASASNDLLGNWLSNKPDNKFLNSTGFALLTGAVSGGVGSVLGGGNFWQGAGQGLIVTAFNYLMHKMQNNDDQIFTSQKELEKYINRNIGSFDRIEKELNTNILLATDENLPKGYNLSGDNRIQDLSDSDKLIGLTEPNGKGGSTVYISPIAKSYEIGSSGNHAIFHELLHAYHMKMGLNRVYSEPATSTYSFAYVVANGDRLSAYKYYYKFENVKIPSAYSWRNMPKFINPGIK